MNGTRLGLYGIGESKGLTKINGKVDPIRSIAVASVSGATGGVIGSPFCLVIHDNFMSQCQSKYVTQ
jgi:hypothetical protein